MLDALGPPCLTANVRPPDHLRLQNKGNAMIMQPMLAAMIGGWEILLILGVLLILALGAAVVAGVIYLIIRATQKKTSTPPPVMPPPTHPGSP